MIRIILSDFFQRLFRYRCLPRVLQFPVTGKCNSRCLTCNVWKLSEKKDVDVNTLKSVLEDRYFSKVQFVGLNGGEPTMHGDFESLLSVVLSLPQIRGISIISNGIVTKRLLDTLSKAKGMCAERKCTVTFTISIDGVDSVHDHVRGVPGSFSKTLLSLEEILRDKDKYCDNVEIGCTISRHNVFHTSEIESFFEDYPVDIFFHLAVPNKRIHTFGDAGYSVLEDPYAKIMAQEFFLGKYISTRNKAKKIRYFLNYWYIRTYPTGRRLAMCNFLRRDVTIDEKLNMYLCATASDRIGDLRESSVKSLYRSGKVREVEWATAKYCDTCIHYASYPNLRGLFVFGRYYVNDVLTWFLKYKLKARWSR